jgi:hypothetical protein
VRSRTTFLECKIKPVIMMDVLTLDTWEPLTLRNMQKSHHNSHEDSRVVTNYGSGPTSSLQYLGEERTVRGQAPNTTTWRSWSVASSKFVAYYRKLVVWIQWQREGQWLLLVFKAISLATHITMGSTTDFKDKFT